MTAAAPPLLLVAFLAQARQVADPPWGPRGYEEETVPPVHARAAARAQARPRSGKHERPLRRKALLGTWEHIPNAYVAGYQAEWKANITVDEAKRYALEKGYSSFLYRRDGSGAGFRSVPIDGVKRRSTATPGILGRSIPISTS